MTRMQGQLLAVGMACAIGAGNLFAGTVEARWLGGGDARLALSVTSRHEPPPDTTEIEVSASLFAAAADAVDPLWRGTLAVPLAGEPPWQAEWPLVEHLPDTNARYRLELRLRHAALGIEYRETVHLERPGSTILSYGYRKNGVFPDNRVQFTFALSGFRTDEQRDLPVVLRLTDADGNLLLDTLAPVRPAREVTWHALDTTPRDPEEPVGPFRSDVAIESDVHGINFRTSHTFAWANAHVPVGGMEDGRPAIWFAAHGTPPTEPHGRGFYYSPQLAEFLPADEPRISFDETEVRSGSRSLRVDYLAGQPAYVWGRRNLPGKPLFLSLWVKGNNSGDRLRVTFEDFINYSRPGWDRRAAFATETICILDFDGWRRFRVPVLGEGHQFDSFAGSSANIDAPIGIKAFRIEPVGRRPADAPAERRTVFIAGLAVETQARPPERLSIERRIGDPDGMLRADDHLTVGVGNGWSTPLRRGRVSLVATDVAGETVYTAQSELEVPARDHALAVFPLAPLAELNPAGPVTVDLAFQDATVASGRVATRIVLKAPGHGGVFLDFAENTVYSGFRPGAVEPPASRIVDLGLSAALELPFKGRTPETDDEEEIPESPGSALMHPSLPGHVASVTVRARAIGADAVLQPWFIDSGETGVGNRPYNMFWPQAIVLEAGADWTEWSFAAPPIPPGYEERGRSFLFEPYYPLNLAFQARPREQAVAAVAGAVQIDFVRVETHLAAAEELQTEIVYADDSNLMPPGTPLELTVRNYARDERVGDVAFSLRNSQGRLVMEKTLQAAVAASEKRRVQLAERLETGIYSLAVSAFDGETRESTLIAINAADFFGDDPLATLRDPAGLRRMLGQQRQTADLDWDNSEPAPGSFEFGWFEGVAKERSHDGRLVIVPVLGFCAEWAGPESAEQIARGDYLRSITNFYQVPQRRVDWDVFVREALREFGPRFDEYAFWENPDSPDSPQHIPPERYRELLASVAHWVRLYAPEASVTAGGFNYDRVLPYLDRINQVETLPFDRIAVQMNVGELSPEAADIEGFLDELDRTLDLTATGREVQVTDCDWGIGRLLTPVEHAAYHARMLLILDSRKARKHLFGLANSGFSFAGHGIFFRRPFGNGLPATASGFGGDGGLQNLKPHYLPKPAFFSLTHMTEFLENHRFVKAVEPPDVCRDRNRVFIYRSDDDRLTAAFWRAQSDRQAYHRPDAWADIDLRDAFGFAFDTDATLEFSPLPYLATFPPGASLEEVVHRFRHLRDRDGNHPVALDVFTYEADSARRADYQAVGAATRQSAAGRLPGRPRRRQETLLRKLEAETFAFESDRAGEAVLTRRWFLDDGGRVLHVRLNDDREQTWDLRSEREDEPGWRESSYLLRGVKAGRNTISIRYERAGNSAGYRVEPLPEGVETINLTRWGTLHALQTRGDMVLHRSAVGTPLRIGEHAYATGFGTHAVSLMEIPLDGQFSALEVTVGVDAHTEGRGSVRFRIFVDEREVANSGIMTGLSEPMLLRVDDLDQARRVLLSVSDAEDGDANDLANWVDGKLFLKRR